MTVSVKEFNEELDMIADDFHIVPLRELMAADAASRGSAKPLAALTFDDALDCQARFALPVLHSRRLPYTLCIPTGAVETGRPLWNTLLRFCILKTSARSLDLGWICFALAPDIDRLTVAGEIQDLLLCMSEPLWREATGALFRQCGDVLDECAAHPAIRPMTWEQIGALDPALFEPASHSALHRPAVEGDAPHSLANDAAASRARIEQRLQRPCTTYCYPFGIFTAASIDALRAAGYQTLLTSCAVPARAMTRGVTGRYDGSAVRAFRAAKAAR